MQNSQPHTVQNVHVCAINHLSEYDDILAHSLVITINSSGRLPYRHPSLAKAAKHLALHFDSVGCIQPKHRIKNSIQQYFTVAHPFDRGQADEIANWLNQSPKSRSLVVAGPADDSRTVAVAMAIATYWYFDLIAQLDMLQNQRFRENGNQYVYNLLSEALQEVRRSFSLENNRLK